MPTVQTIVAAAEAPPPVAPVMVQRGVDPSQESSTVAVAHEAEAAHSAGAAQLPDLDELARKLYPKLRPHLKRELWLDRERAGLLTDLT